MMIERGVHESTSAYSVCGFVDRKLGREGEGFESLPSPPVSLLCVHVHELVFGFVDSWTGRGGKQ